jgi:tRNA pseudouridine38-40 synthase
MRFFIELAFDGTNYHGWQVQPNANTVQNELNNALSKILNNTIEVVGAGRTDAGVHAKQLFAHFDFSENIHTESLKNKLNGFLNKDIVIKNIFYVHDETHARFTAVSRTYEYKISTEKNPFDKNTMYSFRKLDINKMIQACSFLIGNKDFTSFSKSHTQNYTNNCNIFFASWFEEQGALVFRIKADRFLRNMVRAIVGTMIMIGEGKIEPQQMENIINSKDRSSAGFSVPAHALFLLKVEYPKIN